MGGQGNHFGTSQVFNYPSLEPTRPSTNRPFNQPSLQPIKPSTNQAFKQPSLQPFKLSNNQLSTSNLSPASNSLGGCAKRKQFNSICMKSVRASLQESVESCL